MTTRAPPHGGRACRGHDFGVEARGRRKRCRLIAGAEAQRQPRSTGRANELRPDGRQEARPRAGEPQGGRRSGRAARDPMRTRSHGSARTSAHGRPLPKRATARGTSRPMDRSYSATAAGGPSAGRTTMSSPPGNSARSARNAARTRRLKRLRTTALPCCRLTAIPQRVTPRSFRRTQSVSTESVNRTRSRKTASNSAFRRSRTARGSVARAGEREFGVPSTGVQPPGACEGRNNPIATVCP